MIKELDINQIKTVEDYIELTREEYPLYFLGDKKEYSKKGYLLANNSYYVNIQEVNGVEFMGLCKLKDTTHLMELLSLFTKILHERKVVNAWVLRYNSNVVRLLETTTNFFKKKGIEVSLVKEQDFYIYRFKEV